MLDRTEKSVIQSLYEQRILIEQSTALLCSQCRSETKQILRKREKSERYFICPMYRGAISPRTLYKTHYSSYFYRYILLQYNNYNTSLDIECISMTSAVVTTQDNSFPRAMWKPAQHTMSYSICFPALFVFASHGTTPLLPNLFFTVNRLVPAILVYTLFVLSETSKQYR